MTEPEELPTGFPSDAIVAEMERTFPDHAFGGPIPTDEEALVKGLTPLMRRYATLTRQRKQNLAVRDAEVAAIVTRHADIDQKDERETEWLRQTIEVWGRALLERDPDRKSRNLQWGTIKTRHVAAKFAVTDKAALAAELARYGKEVPYNKAPEPTVSLSKLEGILAVLPTIPAGVEYTPSHEKFTVEPV